MPTDARVKAFLEKRSCWFTADRVPGDDATTQFKRVARLRQAMWRGELPIGGECRCPVEKRAAKEGEKRPSRHKREEDCPEWKQIGSRVARSARSDANSLTTRIHEQVKERLGQHVPHQMLLESRLRWDLLSSQPMSFNLFGELALDHELACKVVDKWVPGGVTEVTDVRFEFSPRRRDMRYLNNRTAFDVFVKAKRGADNVFVGIETKYHEHPKKERTPSEERLRLYKEVAACSSAFKETWEAQIIGTDLQQIWLDHLLALSMLNRREEDGWASGLFVLIAPSANPSWRPLADRYTRLLAKPETFRYVSLDDVVDTIRKHAPHQQWVSDFEDRYLNLEPAREALGRAALAESAP